VKYPEKDFGSACVGDLGTSGIAEAAGHPDYPGKTSVITIPAMERKVTCKRLEEAPNPGQQPWQQCH